MTVEFAFALCTKTAKLLSRDLFLALCNHRSPSTMTNEASLDVVEVFVTLCTLQRAGISVLRLDFTAVLFPDFVMGRTCWWSKFAVFWNSVFCILLFLYVVMLFPTLPFLLFTATDCDVIACVRIPCSWLQLTHVLDISFHNTNVLVTTARLPLINTECEQLFYSNTYHLCNFWCFVLND